MERTKVATPTDVPSFVDRIIRPLTHLLNPLILRIAGGRWVPMFSLLHHRGHKSGRIYTTPVTGFPRGDWFWLGLAFGQNSGWARNVLAAGEAHIRYRGKEFHIVEPAVVDEADVKSELPRMVGIGSALMGVHKVMRARIATNE